MNSIGEGTNRARINTYVYIYEIAWNTFVAGRGVARTVIAVGLAFCAIGTILKVGDRAVGDAIKIEPICCGVA